MMLMAILKNLIFYGVKYSRDKFLFIQKEFEHYSKLIGPISIARAKISIRLQSRNQWSDQTKTYNMLSEMLSNAEGQAIILNTLYSELQAKFYSHKTDGNVILE
jgi:hypothetical protein